MSAMSAIFEAAGEEVWWADREGGVCCGRQGADVGDVGE